MRAAAVLSFALMVAAPAGADAATHHFTQAQRYAGCLFGEAVPLMRRGTEREQALAMASDRCVALSGGLSSVDVAEVDVEVHRAIERVEHGGL